MYFTTPTGNDIINSAIKVYPTHKTQTIISKNNISMLRAEILDLQGRIIDSKYWNVSARSRIFQCLYGIYISLIHPKAGVYFIKKRLNPDL